VRKADDCVRWAEETAEHFGRLDILVNCAAGNFLAAAEALSPNGFRTGALSHGGRLFNMALHILHPSRTQMHAPSDPFGALLR